MTELSGALKDTIRFEANYQALFDALMEINGPRFRTLGDKRCRAFVRHGLAVGDQMGLMTVGSVAYLLFLMHWLGSFFHTDPRHSAIHGPLASAEPEEDRIDAAREAFIAFAEANLGDRGEIAVRRLAALPEHDRLVTDISVHHRELHSRLLDVWEVAGEARATYPADHIEDRAVHAAVRLGIDTPLGRRVCLVLVFVLGVGFYKDPLYPWAMDKVTEARAKGESPEAALLAYAKRRLDATLRDGEG